MFSNKIQITRIENKGCGITAVETIEAGELLISETPLLYLKHWSPEHLLEQWNNLDNNDKVCFIIKYYNKNTKRNFSFVEAVSFIIKYSQKHKSSGWSLLD